MLPMRAGDVFIFNVRLFHGTGPNTTEETRGMIEIDYRPVWAHPMMPVAEWDPADVAAVPECAKPFLRSPNSVDRPWEFMPKIEAEDYQPLGMSPSRWGDRE